MPKIKSQDGTTEVKKRGRKPANPKDKKQLEPSVEPSIEAAEESITLNDSVITSNTIASVKESDNIIVTYEETVQISSNKEANKEQVTESIINNSNSDANDDNDNKSSTKKRGRKPKGGKIIQQLIPININKEPKPNVILHLKCSLKDLSNKTIQGSTVDSYNFSNSHNLTYEVITDNSDSNYTGNSSFRSLPKSFALDSKLNDDECESDYNKGKDVCIKEVWKKLKQLEHNLHLNNTCDKKSACFWCTYDFDNPPIYIPKHHIKESYHVYGCFCSPECATAYLMDENIDSSAKFERYHLINHIYSKIYDYTKNIKPAPNPYYMLEKYYGNLTIQEYRSLLKNDRLFLVLDKRLTRILPELHEDNDDFIINNKIIPSNAFQIKKKVQKPQQSKLNILSERFGLAQ
jgi:hypothetical protein